MPFKVTETSLPEVLILEPKVYGDERGFFYESFNAKDFRVSTGIEVAFVQDNHSRSGRGVLRGIHYQLKCPQGKLVRVTRGEVFDVAVDLRRSSPRFGEWVGVVLSETNNRQLWIPPGFGHGFLVVSSVADFQYKTTEYWEPLYERSLLWSDPALGISWPLSGSPTLAQKDAAGIPLSMIEAFV